MRFLVCALLVLAAVVRPAMAQTHVPASVQWQAPPLPDVRPVQVPLTADTVERFISSLPVLIGLARDLDREQGREPQARFDDDLAFLMVPHLFDPAIEARIDGELQDAGFASYAEWANVAHSISIAAEAAEFTGAIDLGSQEQAARADIENNKTLSPDEKAKALAELKNQFAALAEFEPLPGNREVVAPFIERLRKATGG